MFGGATYDEALDGARLRSQLARVREFMLTQTGYLTLAEISMATNDPTTSVSARLRDLRKAQFGGYTVLRRRRFATTALWEYWVR